MVNPEQILLIGRCLERLAIVSGALLAIYLGFRLFYLTSRSKSSAEIKGQSVRVKFIDVGPGVFFCAFGIGTLVYSLSKPIEITYAHNSDGGTDAIASIRASAGGKGTALTIKDFGTVGKLLQLSSSNTNFPVGLSEEAEFLQFKLLVAIYDDSFAKWFVRMRKLEERNNAEFNPEFEKASVEWKKRYHKAKDSELPTN